MAKTFKVAFGSRTIRELGSHQCFPVAGDPVPLEGTGD
jgi:hypothetical protein